MESPDRFQNCARVMYVAAPFVSVAWPHPTRIDGESLGITMSVDGVGTGPMSPGSQRSTGPIAIARLPDGTPAYTAASEPSRDQISQYQFTGAAFDAGWAGETSITGYTEPSGASSPAMS